MPLQNVTLHKEWQITAVFTSVIRYNRAFWRMRLYSRKNVFWELIENVGVPILYINTLSWGLSHTSVCRLQFTAYTHVEPLDGCRGVFLIDIVIKYCLTRLTEVQLLIQKFFGLMGWLIELLKGLAWLIELFYW